MMISLPREIGRRAADLTSAREEISGRPWHGAAPIRKPIPRTLALTGSAEARAIFGVTSRDGLAAPALAAVATIGCSASHSDDLQSESSGAVLSSESVGTQADEPGSELSPEMEKQVSTIADAFDEVERVGWSVDEGVSPIVQVGEDPHDWRVTIPMQRRLSEGERDAERGELVIAVSANGEVGINRPGSLEGIFRSSTERASSTSTIPTRASCEKRRYGCLGSCNA